MLDKFREWISDNLRYILIGLVGILILVIAFFAIRMIGSLGSTKKSETQTEAQTEQTTQAAQVQTEADKTENQLVKNDPAIYNLVERYYTARAAKDFDTLTSICESLDDTEKTKIENEAIESYNNIVTYSKNGMDEGTYVVCVYFDAKITGITTMAPSLRELYVVTDPEKNLIIGDKESSQELQSYIQSVESDADVQALVADVNKLMADATANDEDLKNFVSSQNTTSTTDNTTDGEGTADNTDGTDGSTTAATGKMTATTEINVRGTASTDGTLYGVLTSGMEVNVIENLDSGWSHISYTTSDGTTIEGYVMTQYLTAG